MTTLQRNCTDLFDCLGRRSRTASRVLVDLCAHSYLPDGELQHGWLPRAVSALRKLEAAGMTIGSMCSIGVGPGLEVVAAHEIFGLNSVCVSDLHSDVTRIARRNIVRNCEGLDREQVVGVTGSLCDGLLARGGRYDMLWENLPNLPVASVLDLEPRSRSASFFDGEQYADVPRLVQDHLLVLHYLFLKQAAGCISEGGCVVCCIGLRISDAVVVDLFRSLGFAPNFVDVGMVLQLQAREVLARYQELESQGGKRFSFYPFDEANERMKDLSSNADPTDARAELADIELTASAANTEFRMGTRIGHLGAVVSARIGSGA